MAYSLSCVLRNKYLLHNSIKLHMHNFTMVCKLQAMYARKRGKCLILFEYLMQLRVASPSCCHEEGSWPDQNTF
jgi:hypothetical protein